MAAKGVRKARRQHSPNPSSPELRLARRGRSTPGVAASWLKGRLGIEVRDDEPMNAKPLRAPWSVAADNGPWPLHSAATTRVLEQLALAGLPPHVLMQRAGLSVARLALALRPQAQTFLVFAGPGNNGGDGLVAALCLHQLGCSVQTRWVGDSGRLPADAAFAYQQALGAGLPCLPFDPLEDLKARPGDLAIDALLGLGSVRAPAGVLAEAIQTLNALPCVRLAVDIPSGLNPDTGALLGAAAVRADASLGLLTLKPGCFTAEGRDHAGQMWWDDLGQAVTQPTAWLSGDWQRPARLHATHKGHQGDVVVVGGARGMAGAAWLAAQAALTAGAGRVYTSLLDAGARGNSAGRAELMLRPEAWLAPPAWLQASTVVCGCGGGDAVRGVLPPLLANAGRLVLDADALNAVAADPMLKALLLARGQRGRPTLITPHPLEAARLLGSSSAAVQKDRLGAAQALADSLALTVVLKGSGTVVAAPATLPHINPTGNAALATAGSGDVLAGWVGGWWAQQPTSGPSATPASMAAQVVWLHGWAADQHLAAGQRGPLLAADLISAMARALPS